MKINGIRYQLTATMLYIIVISSLALAVSYTVYDFFTEKSHVVNYQQQTTDLLSDSVTNYLDSQEVFIKSFLNTNYLPDLTDAQKSDAIMLFLSTAKTGNLGSIFENVRYLDNKGRTVVYYSRTNIPGDSSQADLSKTAQFLIPLRENRIYYSQAYIDGETGSPLMTISLPVKNVQSGRTIGIFMAEFNLLSMSELISNLKIGERGIAYIVNNEGKVIVHPDPSVVIGNTYLKVPAKPAVMTGTQNDRSIITASIVSMRNGPPSFSVVAEVPTSDVYDHIFRSMILIVVIILISIGVATVMGTNAFQKIAAPIESLAETAKQLSRGDYSLNSEGRNINELNELARAYRIMTSRLTGAVEDLKAEKKLMDSAINALAHPFYIIDAKSYVIRMANSAANFGDLSASSKCYELTHGYSSPCYKSRELCPLEEIRKTGRSTVLRHEHKGRIMEIHGHPVFDEKGDLELIIEYSMDVTERERILKWTKIQEEQLIRADKMASIGTLAAGMAHEINNPNQVILANGFFLQESWGTIRSILDRYYSEKGDFSVGGMDYSDFREFAGNSYAGIPECARKIGNIVDELKRFSLKDESISLDTIDIAKVIRSSVDLLSYIMSKSALKISLDISDALLPVKGDFRRLEQVMVNFLQNSFQARKGDSVNISIHAFPGEQGDSVIIEISDDGIGIPQPNLKRITEPFFTTKRNSGGTGLGLSVSFAILRELGGTLEFESLEGFGTTARIILPVYREEDEHNEH